MSALDTIKNYNTGDSVQSDTGETAPAPRATYYVGGPKGSGIKGDIAVDATQTEEILKRMQTFIDQRESPLALLMGGLNKAYATTYGPGAALDYQKQQDVEDRQVLDYRTQMAAYRAAQAQAERDAALYAKKMGAGTGSAAGAAPAPGTGAGETPQGQMTYDGIPVPDSVKARLKGTSAHDTPILNEWLKTKTTERIKKEESPSMAAVTQVFGVGDMTVAQAEKYLQNQPHLQAIVNGKKVPLASVVSEAIKKDSASTPAPAPAATPAPAAAVKPTVPGMPTATTPAPAAAVKPAGMPPAATPAPVAAQSVPATVKPSQVVVGPPEPPVASNYIGRQSEFNAAKEKWQKDYDTYNSTKQELGKSGIASIKEEADKFIARTDERVLEKRQGDNDYLKNIIKQWGGNNNVAGVLNEPTWGNAMLTALQRGISAPGGSIALPDIVEVLQRTRPGATKDEVEASKEIARVLGQRILDVVQQSKGSSSDKDWVAFKQIAGTSDNGWDALYKIQRYDEETLKTDKAERNLFNQTYNGQTFDYNKHITNPKRKELYQDLGKNLSEINRTRYKVEKTPPRPSNVPQGAMYNPQLQKWGWYDKNNKWTTN
jgi:hypothetical protein